MGQSMRIFALRRWQLSLTLGARAEAARQDGLEVAAHKKRPIPDLHVVMTDPIGSASSRPQTHALTGKS